MHDYFSMEDNLLDFGSTMLDSYSIPKQSINTKNALNLFVGTITSAVITLESSNIYPTVDFHSPALDTSNQFARALLAQHRYSSLKRAFFIV